MTNKPVLAALILAAGYSSRMGRFKPLLSLGGKSAIEWAIAGFQDAGIPRISVVTGHEADAIESMLRGTGIGVVHNPSYDKGMYSSVQAGLASLSAGVQACFLLPVDIPLVRASTIDALASRYESKPAAVIYPNFHGQRGHPPLIARDLFADVLSGNGDGGLRAFLQRHSADEVAVADEGILLDMDTPEDYARLAELAGRRHLPSKRECEAILEAQGVAEPIRRHSRAVAAVALALAQRMGNLDPNLIVAASLLHDIAKGQPAHAEAGAALVTKLGYPALAKAIGSHMNLDFDGGVPDEVAVVFIADKLVREDRLVSLESRFTPAFERYADQPDALRGAQRKYQTARKVLDAIENHAGMSHSKILSSCSIAA
jgi:putative nucleotidyltransferase with HDIG domain